MMPQPTPADRLPQRRCFSRNGPTRPPPTRTAATVGVRAALALLCSALPAACDLRPAPAPLDLVTVRADVAIVARSRVLVGHQSVGRDVLAGVGELAADSGVALRIVEIDGEPPDEMPGLFHSTIGRNGDPEGKCEVFLRLLDRPARPRYDVAMMKFCYVDLGRETALDAARLLDRYSALVVQLRAARPDITLVHVTMPLRAAPRDWRSVLKRWLGRDSAEDADNALRNAFNEGLRARFGGEPLYDLAAVESTRADGSRSAFIRGGVTVYTLASEYTTDGGHLNPGGRQRAAAAFLHSVAAAVRDRP
jgi:hypothetical protein